MGVQQTRRKGIDVLVNKGKQQLRWPWASQQGSNSCSGNRRLLQRESRPQPSLLISSLVRCALVLGS